jgi:hypothetical protein
MPPKRPAEAIDLTNDTPFYSSQPYANASSSQGYAHASSSQGYAQSSPHGRAPKQARTGYGRTSSGASQQDPVYIDDDEEEDVSATQGLTEQQYTWTLYGVMHGKIVGCRFYNGYATVGEMVVARRQPANSFDSKLGLWGYWVEPDSAQEMQFRSLMCRAIRSVIFPGRSRRSWQNIWTAAASLSRRKSPALRVRNFWGRSG